MFETIKKSCRTATNTDKRNKFYLYNGELTQFVEEQEKQTSYPNQNASEKIGGTSILKYDNKTIKKNDNRKNSWYIRYYKNGIQKTVYGKTQKQVIKNYKLALKENEQEKQNKTYTLKKWYVEYMQLYKIGQVKDTTIKKTDSDFKQLKSLHNCHIDKLNVIDIQTAINKIKGKAVALRTYILLNALLEKATNLGIINRNIMKIVDKPKYKAKEKIALTHEEEQIFVLYCDKNEYGDFFKVCLYQGLRRGECQAIKLNDIDFENKTLKIDESINPNTTRKTTKNEQSNRIMPLFDRTANILKKYIQNKNKNDYIFDYKTRTIENNLKKIIKEANIKYFTTHILRHTFITRCQEQNIPLFVVQKWVGHEKGSIVTQKIYTHLNNETNNKYIDIFNK